MMFVDSYAEHKYRFVYLYKETEHHLLVPRKLWPIGQLPFRVIDCRPRTYTRTGITSRIRLDHRLLHGQVVPTGDSVQQQAMDALLPSDSGVLQLGCVSGGTIINLNRAGKGFKCTVREAWQRLNEKGRYSWDPSIPTQIRSLLDGRIGLQPVLGIIKKPHKMRTYELLLEDGKRLRLTSDHEVLTTKGYKNRLNGLKVGDKVITDGKAPKHRKDRPVYKRLAWYDSHPFAHKNGLRGKEQRIVLEEHRAVAEAKLNKMTLGQFRDLCRVGDIGGLLFIDPTRFHVHHKDGDHTNNHPDNLEVRTVEDHLAEHRPGAAAFGDGYPTPVKIISMTEEMEEEVFDIACPAPHNNFVANGMVIHNCGKGKTVVALDYIARTGGPAIIVVDNTHLLEQWANSIKTFLDVPGGVGRVQGKVFDWQKGIVLATYQTLGNLAAELGEDFKSWFMTAIYDEGHHIPAATFAPGVEVIYGRRIILTATPERDDGLHIISDSHVGGTIYKDITHKIKPRVHFRWTGLEVPPSADVLDKNEEVHLSKVSSFFGTWVPRMSIILEDVHSALSYGRKVLVLCNAVDEAVNLCSMWTQKNWNNPAGTMYSDILVPTPMEVGSAVPPVPMTQKQVEHTQAQLQKYLSELGKSPTTRVRENLEYKVAELQLHLMQAETHKKITSVLSARQKAYRDWLTSNLGDAGLMIHAVDAKSRFSYIKTKRVVFAITKYGREGLDDEDLDTVLVSTPFSKRATLQQVLGRPGREKQGKKFPLVVFYEDNVGPLIGMCKKLRGHLSRWPIEESGPFAYEMYGHPKTKTWNHQTIFGQ